ncbi:unnamed protein product [Phytophthora fragariaefolia]|uniref:Unnamed protein product n=1 Tax=Phytophthora fragariaefolia TaxID=1490495 RepID=A0A9W7CZY7_9STRA|nr:unnamed protein product [Phytophthora fragariaefolia]
MATPPLLLAARELARGPTAALPSGFEVAAAAASAAHLAVLFRSRSGPNCVRLGVFETDAQAAAEDVELVDLLTDADDAPREGDDDAWTLAWSPDRKFLVVGGRIPRAGGASDGVLWVYARPEWLAASAGPPLLLRVDPATYLSAKLWDASTSLVGVFFPTQSGSKLCVISGDGVWLSVDVQLAKLALVAMDRTAAEDTAGLFTMKVAKKLTEWHAGVTAASFEPESSTLVLSGGVKDPGADLVEKQPSSLSVWKVARDVDSKEVADLLDFTMVVTGKKQDEVDEEEEEGKSEGEMDDDNSGGILTSVTSTLLAPFRMMVGGETSETIVIKGSIRHLALAPNGNFVSMVDDRGRVAMRQIDACADILDWQTVENVSTTVSQDAKVKLVEWLTSALVALVLTNSSIVYSKFIPTSGSELTSSDSESEDVSPLGPSGRLLLASAKHYRPSVSAATSNIATLTLASSKRASENKHSGSFFACEVIVSGELWHTSLVENLPVEPFIDVLMDAHKFDDALEIVALFDASESALNADYIHRRIWMQYREEGSCFKQPNDDECSATDSEFQDLVFLSTRPRGLLQRGERTEFADALDHLRAISDKQWVLGEGLHLVSDDSSANMKKILDLAWDAWVSLNADDDIATELSQEKVDLQRYMYRLETMCLVLCEEESVSITSVAADHIFDGVAYAQFRSSSVLTAAKQFAREGRVCALGVLLRRNAWNLLPQWFDILELLPPSVPPSMYASLLPAIASQIEDDGQLYTLSKPDNSSVGVGDDNEMATPVTLLSENQLQDLTDEELTQFEEYTRVNRNDRNSAYGEWFRKKILELDTRYGQLAFAYELSSLAAQCLIGWSQEEKKTLEEFFLHTERLYKCVYSLHLSSCCLLPLNEWSVLSIQDQAMVVVGTDEKEFTGDVSPVLDRLDTVFVSQRRGRMYALDDLFSWLAQTVSTKSSLGSLTLAAQLIYRSNPSISLHNRWIQSDVRLIETALDVVYSVDASDIIGDKLPSVDEDVCMQRHVALVEQLWTIFQSLPVRKENDPPEIARLQVAVDEMEDLMVTMDVLSKYGIVSSPSGLKYRMLASGDIGVGGGTGVGPHGLLEQMCDFALPIDYSGDEENGDGNQWMEVLQDAVKLKEHAFGERLSQEMILDIILKHLLLAPERVYIDAAQNLVNHWIASDVEAIDHVLDELLVVIRSKLDSVVGYSEDAQSNTVHESALCCIKIVKQLLSHPVWNEGGRAEYGAKQHFEDILALETDTAHACKLLDLLTYGAVKLSPSELRSSPEEQEEANARLDAVCQVFVSNPSNYKPSIRAREWLSRHHGLAEAESVAELWDEPLAAIMHLAKLLRVDSQKLDIWMKGAYAALYCMDYDVAYDLTMQVIDGIPTEVDLVVVAQKSSGDKLTLLHLVSLVLDLVSASSFRSWGKKHKLCCALFSAVNIVSSDLFEHQVTDLVLLWLEKIEAIQSLMVELGLTDNELDERRLSSSKATSSAEAVLLNELKVVVDLLHEEKNDRQFLLRLLQRGYLLTQVMGSNYDAEVQNEGNAENISAFLQQMVGLCVEEALELTSTGTGGDSEDWQQFLELGFSYLVLWSNLCTDDGIFEAFCTNDVLPLVLIKYPVSESHATSDTAHTSDVVVRRLRHFFLFQVAQAKEDIVDNSETMLGRRKRLEALSSSYEAVRRVIDSPNGDLGEASSDTTSTSKHFFTMSEQRQQIYVKLAQQCQEQLVSQKKSQELEQMNTFFNTELDLEQFTQDESYRNEKIMLLASKKEHFQLSRQFASKYGIDDYECVLAYIRHVLLYPSDSSQLGRREQLDQAFRIEQTDILEEALQRPISFGDFLLGKGSKGEPSVYERIDGTDHVGILLVLRMVLECSKRIYQDSAESVSPHERSRFPLPKSSTDRVTLLFMCLKKIKEIGDALGDAEPVDLKLIGAASTTTELLTPLASSRSDPQDMTANRDVAVEAVRPLLNGKTIKFVTKVLRKLHRVTPSAMVMIYINDLLAGIWIEHGATGNSKGALSADLAVYAYESCVPCLSVLSNEHLMLFHYLFLDGSSGKPTPELVSHLNITEEFYGQPLNDLSHFGALLTPQKRVEFVTDTLTLFQTKYNSWQNSGPRSNVSSASSTSSSSSGSWDPAQFKRKEQELHYLERELADNVCYMLLNESEQSGLTLSFGATKAEAPQTLETVASSLKAWFAMDPLQQAANEEVRHNTVLMGLCQCVASVDLATLVMELALRAGGSKANGDVAANAITQSYQATITKLVDQSITSGEGQAKQTAPWVERLAWTWVTGSATPNSNQVTELEHYLRVMLCSPCEQKDGSRAIYERVVTMLSHSPSALLKEIGLIRLEAMQTPADEVEVKSTSMLVREAILLQWQQMIAFSEEQHKWVEAAVLSHLLATCESEISQDTGMTKWFFGLHVKAVWTALLTKHKFGENPDSQRILVVPSVDISDHFPAVFEELLSFIEVCSGDENPKALRFAEVATVALSNLLVHHDEALGIYEGAAQRSALAWQNEQTLAVHTRIQAQFQVGTTAERQRPSLNGDDAACWSALFVRGVWGARLLKWYTTHAYAELSNEEEATEAVILVHWEANNLDLAIQLLLMCPFDSLREKYAERALSVVCQLPRGSRSWFAAVELALLRFDVAVLLQHGLHSSVVAFLLHDTAKKPALWTSSGDYVVCALVKQGEFAAAGRLSCALRHTHPLLWDLENARLLLASYLRSLATSPVQHKSHDAMELARLKHEVYVQTSTRFASTFI